MEFKSVSDYLTSLEAKATLPKGFKTSSVGFTFFPKERPVDKPLPMKLNLLLLDEPTASFAGAFTQNAFPGAPVILGREILQQPQVQGVLINNKISNVGSPTGVEDSRRLCTATEGLLQCSSLFPSSTGIIGWSLPVPEMEGALPGLVEGLQSLSALPLAQGIMTTDSYPKLSSITLGEGRILGVAKGAGMIEPNLATMLVFLVTDIKVSREELRGILSRVIQRSFNSISVDSDQSTSDTVLAFSSNHYDAPSLGAFEAALELVCLDLAKNIVRNGEGTSHVLDVTVSGAPDYTLDRDAAKAVVNSPLVKTAIYGNDPNLGRLVSSLGDFWGNKGLKLDSTRLQVTLGGETVFSEGAFRLDKEKELRLSLAMKTALLPEKKEGFPPHSRSVEITFDLGLGNAKAQVWGSDLSHEYIHENADYRS